MKISFTILILALSFQLNGQEQACKCCTAPHQAFNFWVGSWSVTNADGTPAGKNTIEKVQNQCVIKENWTSAKGNYTGTSNNFYNSTTKQWEQIWIDNQGQSLHLKGNKIDNKMILTSEELINAKGEKYMNRITWTHNDNGTVRQLWELVQNGKVTSVAFDGLYIKQKEQL